MATQVNNIWETFEICKMLGPGMCLEFKFQTQPDTEEVMAFIEQLAIYIGKSGSEDRVTANYERERGVWVICRGSDSSDDRE